MMRRKLDNLMGRVSEIQEINLDENGVSFAKDGFTDLYNLVSDVYLLDAKGLIAAENRGIIKGIAVSGLIAGIGAYGYYRWKGIEREVELELVEEQGE